MSEWTRITDRDDLWEGEMRGFVVGGIAVLLVHIDGELHAYLNRCAHQGAALSAGFLEGATLTCRAHHWRYDVRTGRGINPVGSRLTEMPVQLQGQGVYVDITGVDADPDAARIVGPVLLRSSAARAVAEAIRATNPHARLEPRGAYVRVLAPSPCVVTRSQVSEVLGMGFELPGDLEQVMPSYRGRLTMTEDEIRWE